MKKNTLLKISGVAVAVLMVIVPVFLLAQVPPNPGEPPTITNPLSGISDIPSLILTIVNAIKTIGYYVVVVFIIYSGFLFVKARGDEKGLQEAKKAFLYTVIGAAILLGASILSEVINNTVNQINQQGAGAAAAILLDTTYL